MTISDISKCHLINSSCAPVRQSRPGRYTPCSLKSDLEPSVKLINPPRRTADVQGGSGEKIQGTGGFNHPLSINRNAGHGMSATFYLFHPRGRLRCLVRHEGGVFPLDYSRGMIGWVYCFSLDPTKGVGIRHQFAWYRY